MTVAEVRDQMLAIEERLRRARLLRLELSEYRHQVDQMVGAGQHVRSTMDRFDTSAFKPLLAETVSLFPEDDQLVADLLRLPRLGALINRWLDHANSPTRSARKEDIIADTTEIQKMVTGFQVECVACEQRFDDALRRLGV